MTIERLCADALVDAERRIEARIAERVAARPSARRICESQLGDETTAVREALRAFAELGTALIGARERPARRSTR